MLKIFLVTIQNSMIKSEYIQINLNNLIDSEEADLKSLLSNFSCPKNKDVETFLKERAIEFSRSGIAKTHLVFWRYEKNIELIGYYSLAPKVFTIEKNAISKNKYKQLSRFNACSISNDGKKIIPAILIGQLGKNYKGGNDTLITGKELLELAVQKVKDIQMESGGRYTYLECEDVKKVKDFYEKNGFTQFGKRNLEVDETNIKGQYLIQYLKKI